MEFSSYDDDDALIERGRASGEAQLELYRPAEVMVVLGRGSRAEIEVDLERCERDGVAVRRRRGGGCAVVLDPGNLIVSCTLPVHGIGDNTRHIRALSSWLIAGLEQLGVRELARAGVSDLVQAGRKISGSCIYRPRGLLYYSASILVDADLGLLERYLKHPPREPDYRRGRGHRDFVGNMKLPGGLRGVAELEKALRQTLEAPRPAEGRAFGKACAG